MTPDVDPAAPQTSKAHSGNALANAPLATGSAHTPGPWFVGRREQEAIVVGSEEGLVLYRAYPDFKLADARLIASAPELLEACRAIVAWDEAEKNAKPFDEDAGAGFYDRIGMCQDAFNAARAAIQKATGDQQ